MTATAPKAQRKGFHQWLRKNAVGYAFLMPFLCSGSDNAGGVLFYPDGSGAILEFRDYTHFKETAQTFTVYGTPDQANAILHFFDQEASVGNK